MFSKFSKSYFIKKIVYFKLKSLTNKHIEITKSGMFKTQVRFKEKEDFIQSLYEVLQYLFVRLSPQECYDFSEELSGGLFKTSELNRQLFCPLVSISKPKQNEEEDWVICRYMENLFFNKPFNPSTVTALNDVGEKIFTDNFRFKLTVTALFSCVQRNPSYEQLTNLWIYESPIESYPESKIKRTYDFYQSNRAKFKELVDAYANAGVFPSALAITYYISQRVKGKSKEVFWDMINLTCAGVLIEYRNQGRNPPFALLDFIRGSEDSKDNKLSDEARILVQHFCGFSFEEMTIGYKPTPVKPTIENKD